MAAQPGSYDRSLVFVSRLTKGEAAQVHNLATAFPGLGQAEAIRSTIVDVILERAILADGLILLAKRLRDKVSGSDSEIEYRASVGRSYYAIHHSVRAMILHECQYEEDGHSSSLKALKKLLDESSFRNRSGLVIDSSCFQAE